jgi:hypothetical protein
MRATTLVCVRTPSRALLGYAVRRGSAVWGATVLALAACGGRVGRANVDGGSRGDAIAPVSPSSSSGGEVPPGTAGPVGSSSAGSIPPSSGPSTGSAPPGTIPEDASPAPTMPSPNPATNCMPSPAGESAGSGQCASMLVNDCNGTRYQVICTCPEQQCACFGPTTKIIPYGGCPYCPFGELGPQAPGGPSISDLFAACGYPH